MARQDPTRDSCTMAFIRFALVLGGLIALAAVIF